MVPFWSHIDASIGASRAHKFDENPYAFRPSLPVRAQSLSTKCSTLVGCFCVHSDAGFDENPCAILRVAHWHGNVNLTAWDVRLLHRVLIS